jgi:hypothetical protein
MSDIKNNAPIEWVMEEIVDCGMEFFDLARLAEKRSGYCNSNGGHGVSYPHELDEYQRVTEGTDIPEEHVLMFGRGGFPGGDPGYEFYVPESRYLEVLARILEQRGFKEKSDLVRSNKAFPQQMRPDA